MAILDSLLSVNEPRGFWITIIKAFEAVTNNYVLAIIFLTVVLRVIWAIVELGTKYNQQNMTAMQSRVQPEIEKINQKYEKQPQILKQKQNEVYKKYYGKKYYGSCILSLLSIVLNSIIFLTLLSGLNQIGSYKNSVSYDNIKYTYANCINVTDEFLTADPNNADYFEDYQNLSFEFSGEGEARVVKIVHNEQGVLFQTSYKDQADFTTTIIVPAEKEGEQDQEKQVTNQNIIALIEKYIPVYQEGEEVGSKEIKVWTLNQGTEEESTLYFSTALQNVAMKNVVEVYDQTREGFLWIKNIWIADSPISKSIVNYKTLEGQIGKKNIEEGEETIYNSFMKDLKAERSTSNGYFLLPILIVATAILSMYLTNLYNKRKNAKKGLPPMKQNAGWTKIIIPALLGLVALLSNSVFSIYLLAGQVVAVALLYPQLMLVDYFIDKKNKKEEDKTKVTVDYSRKF